MFERIRAIYHEVLAAHYANKLGSAIDCNEQSEFIRKAQEHAKLAGSLSKKQANLFLGCSEIRTFLTLEKRLRVISEINLLEVID